MKAKTVSESLNDLLKPRNDSNEISLKKFGVPYNQLEQKLKKDIESVIPPKLKKYIDVLTPEEHAKLEDELGFDEDEKLPLSDNEIFVTDSAEAFENGMHGVMGGSYVVTLHPEHYIKAVWVNFPEDPVFGLEALGEKFKNFEKYI